MKIRVITCCKNEEMFLPFFLRHYCSFCDEVVIYDGHSTDRSVEIINMYPKTTLLQEDPGIELDERVLMDIRNNRYKVGRENFDWQIIVDIDEILYHENLLGKLEEYKKNGVTIPKICGYQMYSQFFPTGNKEIYEIINTGIYDPLWHSKLAIFNPKKVEINYKMGCHECNPIGDIVFSQDSNIKLLHYRAMSYEYFVNKSAYIANRRSSINKENNWAFHCVENSSMSESSFNDLIKKSQNVFTGEIIVEKENPNIPKIDLLDFKNQCPSTYNEIIQNNLYNILEDELKNKNILDIGANIGMFSVHAIDKNANFVIAVEANPQTFKILEKNTFDIKKIKCINLAVFHKSEYVSIQKKEDWSDTDGRCYISSNGDIKTIALKNLLSFFSDQTKEFVLKIDAEGSEYDILYGSDYETINRFSIIYLETHEGVGPDVNKNSSKFDAIENYLEFFGFIKRYSFDYVPGKSKMVKYTKSKEIKINVGCGHKTFKGYINIDKTNKDADIIADAMDLPFHNNSVDEVYSSHVIEHFHFHDGFNVLREWRRVLKEGGKIIIECPDLLAICKKFVNGNEDDRILLYQSIFGVQWWEGFSHKFGYTPNQLRWTLEESGFGEIVQKEPLALPECPDICMRFEAIKIKDKK